MVTVTGWGGTLLEKGVPNLEENIIRIKYLIDSNIIPKERIRIRIDPIIPTELGITKARTVMEFINSTGLNDIEIISSIFHCYENKHEMGVISKIIGLAENENPYQNQVLN